MSLTERRVCGYTKSALTESTSTIPTPTSSTVYKLQRILAHSIPNFVFQLVIAVPTLTFRNLTADLECVYELEVLTGYLYFRLYYSKVNIYSFHMFPVILMTRAAMCVYRQFATDYLILSTFTGLMYMENLIMTHQQIWSIYRTVHDKMSWHLSITAVGIKEMRHFPDRFALVRYDISFHLRGHFRINATYSKVFNTWKVHQLSSTLTKISQPPTIWWT